MQGIKSIPFVIRTIRRIAVLRPLSSALCPPSSVLRPPSYDRRSTRAFTLIEMMVVMGMLAILMGVAFSGIGQARSQARVAKANVELRELINAWLSYEAAYDDWPVDVSGTDLPATAANLKELLGENDEKAVYLNAQLVGGAFLDPWGTPYHFRLITAGDASTQVQEKFPASVTFPNRHRYVR